MIRCNSLHSFDSYHNQCFGITVTMFLLVFVVILLCKNACNDVFFPLFFSPSLSSVQNVSRTDHMLKPNFAGLEHCCFENCKIRYGCFDVCILDVKMIQSI